MISKITTEMFVYSILIQNIRNLGYLTTSMKSNYLEEGKLVASVRIVLENGQRHKVSKIRKHSIIDTDKSGSLFTRTPSSKQKRVTLGLIGHDLHGFN